MVVWINDYLLLDTPVCPCELTVQDAGLHDIGYTDKADSFSFYPFGNNVNDSKMANLPTDMELEQALSQRNSTRTPSSQPQLKYNKA
ncbi:hypothetical protein TNCV_203561 [Trichonephila clavipes]|nr:hypothetical protein TNCV_203561 [Trichonephila clavipes]